MKNDDEKKIYDDEKNSDDEKNNSDDEIYPPYLPKKEKIFPTYSPYKRYSLTITKTIFCEFIHYIYHKHNQEDHQKQILKILYEINDKKLLSDIPNINTLYSQYINNEENMFFFMHYNYLKK